MTAMHLVYVIAIVMCVAIPYKLWTTIKLVIHARAVAKVKRGKHLRLL
jgi:hypothetical protein